MPPKTDVKGRWIWLPDPAGRDWRNCYAYFRRTFTAAGELTLHIAADTAYELHLDGALVERGTAPVEVSYKTFDTHRLKVGPGRHVLAILVHHLGQQCATAMRSRPGLWVEMTGAGSDPMLSDASWKTLRATAYQQWLPCMMSHFGFYEVCDHAQIPAGWTTTEFCMLDTFVDCPTRERVLWMDMAVEAHCSVYGFGDTALWRRCLYLFAQNPAREGAVAGAIKGFVPCDYDISYCHGWGAGAVVQLPAYVLGIRPVAPGWKEIEILPQRAGLEWAEGSVPTPHGDIKVSWRMENGVPKLEYQVPPGIKVVRAAFV